jgi:hypothetical protein
LLLHIICDYAPGDLAWAEVVSAVTAHAGDDVRLHLTAVGSFETIATGFVLAQIALADKKLRPEKMIVFANCAPRKDIPEARANNEGEGLLYAVLSNGVEVLATNSGFSMSFVKDQIKELYSVDIKDEGSQFRSRDYFPSILGKLAKGDRSFKWNQLRAKSVIPEMLSPVIAYIDSFGNLKTTIRAGDPLIAELKAGDRIKVRIGSIIRTATVATGSFNVLEGDLAFAPGSSGQDRRYWEFFQRGGSAALEFGRPTVGTKISIDSSH